MSAEFEVERAGDILEFLACDNVGEIKGKAGRVMETEVCKFSVDGCSRVVKVDVSDRIFAVLKMLEEGVASLFVLDKEGRTGFRVLIDADKLLVLERCEGRVGHVADVAADHKGRCEVAPESEVHEIFLVGAAGNGDVALTVHTGDEHIDIVEAAGSVVALEIHLAYRKVAEAAEAVVDVAGGAVQVSAGGADPLVNLFRTPVAGGEDDVASACLESHGHSVVENASGKVRLVAVVVLEVIHAPVSEGLRVDEFVVEGGGISGAGQRTVAGIHTEFQSLGVNIIGKGFHSARELFGIGNDSAVLAALAERPAVVDDDIIISGVGKSGFDNGVCGFLDEVFGNVRAEGVP